MNLYIYICLIFFGIIIFLLWNHKNKFSIGGGWQSCNSDFIDDMNYGVYGVYNIFNCCDNINNNLFNSINNEVDFNTGERQILDNIDNILNRPGILSPDYTEQKNNIRAYVRGVVLGNILIIFVKMAKNQILLK